MIRRPPRGRNRFALLFGGVVLLAPLAAAQAQTPTQPAQTAPAQATPTQATPTQTAPTQTAPTQTPAPQTGPSAEQAEAAAAKAKDLNREGLALVKAGDPTRALDFFLRSRAVLPTSKNTTNAAITLDQLGRYDEALELYEELLLRYAGGLDDEDRAAIAPAMAALRDKVGSVQVSSNVGGEVTIDGRARGKLPFLTPLRVLGGKHSMRVTRVGYAPYETTFECDAGKTTSVDAILVQVKGVGTVVVEDVEGTRADVFVDGTRLGTTPWEGALPHGKHVVWLRTSEGRGSAPSWIDVLEGQAAIARLQTRPLGPEVTIRVEPRSAEFELDGVPLGPGTWQGRWPSGSHVLSASERGYHPVTRRLELPSGGAPVDMTVKLTVDADDPRWPKPKGSLVTSAFGGVVVGPSLAGGYTSDCPERCASESAAFGFLAGARGGYRFPSGIAIEFSGGYMSIRQEVTRTETSTFGDAATQVTYDLTDRVHVHGPFVGLGASFRTKIGRLLFAGTRATAGVLVASSGDPIEGTGSAGGSSRSVVVEEGNSTVLSAAPFITPEVFAGVRAGPLDVALSLGASFFVAQGPQLSRGRFGVEGAGDSSNPESVANAQESNVVEGERAYGRFAVIVPALTVGTAF